MEENNVNQERINGASFRAFETTKMKIQRERHNEIGPCHHLIKHKVVFY